ncbi:MAG: ATP-binding protein [Desulfobacterales bacterium]|nr:ATP-binding protein [Desulfobacterales bacterium]
MNIETYYRIFRYISTSVHSSTDVNEVLGLAVKSVTEAVHAKGALLRILNLGTHQLELNAAYGLNECYLSKGHVSSQEVIAELCKQNKVVVIEDVLASSRVQYPQAAREQGIKMMMDVPLFLGDHVVGIVRIFFSEQRKFSEEEINFLVSISEQCAIAIEKTRLIEKHKSMYDHLALQTEKLSALGRMAAGIAHEINNPLGGILLYSSSLAKKVPPGGPLKEGLEIIIHEAMRCKNIIQDLLEFSREKEPEKTFANINQIIRKTLGMLENEFRLHHIKLETHLFEEMPNILVDVNQMQQVLVNLLLNAIEAVQDQGLVSIRSQIDPPQKNVKVEISDSGCGISPENIGKVFEPFFTTKSKGTGLGLAVTFRIVQNHKGNLHVFSRPGERTRFTIELPVA